MRVSLKGRPLPAMDVSYPVAQVEGQLSGDQVADATGAGRPRAELRSIGFEAAKRTAE
jgi:hypothetical protein